MKEEEWLTCANPDQMLVFLGRRASRRKRRLFACACYRHVPILLSDHRCLTAIVVSERYADGLATKAELSIALTTAQHHFPRHWPSALPTPDYAEDARKVAAREARDGLAERKYQADIIRCIFGNPFRSPQDLTVFVRTNSTVGAIAKSIQSAFVTDALPILADAMEDAGCDNTEMLNHLRGPGPHVRGCWALDLILNKQ